MASVTKVNPKKAATDAKKVAGAAKDKLQNNAVTQAAGNVFGKIKAKTGIDAKKVDAWQAKWIALPENRKKYEHLTDVPEVLGEEIFAMTNDIVDFCQGQEGGKSNVFKSIKENVGGFLKHPVAFLKQKGEEGKKKALEAKNMAAKKAGEAKKATGKGTAIAGGLGLAGLLSKAKAGIGAAKEKATQAKEMAGKAKNAATKAKDVATKAKGAVKK